MKALDGYLAARPWLWPWDCLNEYPSIEIEQPINYDSPEYRKMEIAGLKEWIDSEPASKLSRLVKTHGQYKGELHTLTVKQFHDLYRRYPPASSLTPDGHVRWEYSLDVKATELGYEDGDALKEAIEQVAEARTRIRNLERL